MTVTRREVLEYLAKASDATEKETTTAHRLASQLQTDTDTILEHVERLQACALARKRPDGRLRITITGEELLALDTDDVIIVDSTPQVQDV